jgi:23S rRNA (guanosine2251-2'-O)-methyltransferase
MKKLNARQLRTSDPLPHIAKALKKHPIYLILDNVLDTYNTGSLFRLADALQIEKIFLCGQTETPPNTRIKKASINTWQWVAWEYVPTAHEAVEKLKIQNPNIKTCVVEQHEKSISLYDFKPEFPLALVVGNETYGVSKEVLDMADTIVEIPMWGVNTSLNVMVSAGIVLYKIAQYF